MSKKKEKEPDPAEILAEEMKKPYYNVDYLDNFKLPYDKLDVSIVIPTYNRCPYKPSSLREERNPLIWAIKTSLMQKPVIKEIIIVDDCSTDNTEDVVKKYQEESKEKELVPIKYIKLEKRHGAGVARNIGVDQASGKYLFFSDDDMFASPYSVFGALYTYEWLIEQGINVGIVNLPFYSRSSIPNKIVKKCELARVSFLRGEYTANKTAFPEEYLTEANKTINNEYYILRPIPIENSGGFAFCEKRKFLDVGGFPGEIIRRGEDRELGFRFIENGYPVYFTPDPKFHGVHGSYGLKLNRGFVGEDWFKKRDKTIGMKRAMDFCDNPKKDTGARIDPKEFIHDAILSFFILVYIRNKRGALKWIKKVDREFVLGGETGIFGNKDIPVPSKEERKEMFLGALKKGLNYIINLEKEQHSVLISIIKELEEKHEKDEKNIIDSFEKMFLK